MREVYSPAFCREAVAEARRDPADFLRKVERLCTKVTVDDVKRSMEAWGIPVPRDYNTPPRKHRD